MDPLLQLLVLNLNARCHSCFTLAVVSYLELLEKLITSSQLLVTERRLLVLLTLVTLNIVVDQIGIRSIQEGATWPIFVCKSILKSILQLRALKLRRLRSIYIHLFIISGLYFIIIILLRLSIFMVFIHMIQFLILFVSRNWPIEVHLSARLWLYSASFVAKILEF